MIQDSRLLFQLKKGRVVFIAPRVANSLTAILVHLSGYMVPSGRALLCLPRPVVVLSAVLLIWVATRIGLPTFNWTVKKSL